MKSYVGLTTNRNESKWIIFVSSEFGALQMVLELVTERCARCHGHVLPRRVTHGHMPMTSQTLHVFLCCSFFTFVFIGNMTF